MRAHSPDTTLNHAQPAIGRPANSRGIFKAPRPMPHALAMPRASKMQNAADPTMKNFRYDSLNRPKAKIKVIGTSHHNMMDPRRMEYGSASRASARRSSNPIGFHSPMRMKKPHTRTARA